MSRADWSVSNKWRVIRADCAALIGQCPTGRAPAEEHLPPAVSRLRSPRPPPGGQAGPEAWPAGGLGSRRVVAAPARPSRPAPAGCAGCSAAAACEAPGGRAPGGSVTK
eukprot:8358400-Pyramimonas_sp.AAC.1